MEGQATSLSHASNFTQSEASLLICKLQCSRGFFVVYAGDASAIFCPVGTGHGPGMASALANDTGTSCASHLGHKQMLCVCRQPLSSLEFRPVACNSKASAVNGWGVCKALRRVTIARDTGWISKHHPIQCKQCKTSWREIHVFNTRHDKQCRTLRESIFEHGFANIALE